jgi:hypothetical protein
MKSIPLSELAGKVKQPKVKTANPVMPTGRRLDELRVQPASNGYTIHTHTNPLTLPKGESATGAYVPPSPHVAKSKAEALAHISNVLDAHEAQK